MTLSAGDLLARLRPDIWRAEAGFSPEVESAQEQLFCAGNDDRECVRIINEWIEKYQPCLFGRIAAKLRLISYCILRESDLQGTEEKLREKIQSARTQWTREGFEGKASGLVILVVSPKITNALPNEDMKELARRICSLYLLDEISTDTIHLDEIFLEMPGIRKTTWKWSTGVNYFCAHGDRRWWNDHRIPGGMAFSINSVGHMIKSGALAKAMTELEKLMGAPDEGWTPSRIDSPEDALQYAMLTIDNASEAISGKATELLPLPSNATEMPVRECPIKLPKILQDKNYCEYVGYYHTDYTIPSEYFLPAVERPSVIRSHRLDFTYLIAKHADSPDLLRLLQGQQIRGVGERREPLFERIKKKYEKSEAIQVSIETNARLKNALSR